MINPFEIAGLRMAQEHDEAQCVAWLKDTAIIDQIHVWDRIQTMGGDPVTEIISRFAQLGMTHGILLASKE